MGAMPQIGTAFMESATLCIYHADMVTFHPHQNRATEQIAILTALIPQTPSQHYFLMYRFFSILNYLGMQLPRKTQLPSFMDSNQFIFTSC